MLFVIRGLPLKWQFWLAYQIVRKFSMRIRDGPQMWKSGNHKIWQNLFNHVPNLSSWAGSQSVFQNIPRKIFFESTQNLENNSILVNRDRRTKFKCVTVSTYKEYSVCDLWSPSHARSRGHSLFKLKKDE